ncbi:hypothetical protein J6590_085858, partial [Homalodisca vitripennis]
EHFRSVLSRPQITSQIIQLLRRQITLPTDLLAKKEKHPSGWYVNSCTDHRTYWSQSKLTQSTTWWTGTELDNTASVLAIINLQNLFYDYPELKLNMSGAESKHGDHTHLLFGGGHQGLFHEGLIKECTYDAVVARVYREIQTIVATAESKQYFFTVHSCYPRLCTQSLELNSCIT